MKLKKTEEADKEDEKKQTMMKHKTTKQKRRHNTDKERQGLVIQEGRGAQVRTIRGRTDNETQVKIMRQKKKWKAGKQGIGSKGAKQPTADETFQNKTGNPQKNK